MANAFSARGGCVSAEVIGRDVYSCTISEPATDPVLVSLSDAMMLKSAAEPVGWERAKSEYLKLV